VVGSVREKKCVHACVCVEKGVGVGEWEGDRMRVERPNLVQATDDLAHDTKFGERHLVSNMSALRTIDRWSSKCVRAGPNQIDWHELFDAELQYENVCHRNYD